MIIGDVRCLWKVTLCLSELGFQPRIPTTRDTHFIVSQNTGSEFKVQFGHSLTRDWTSSLISVSLSFLIHKTGVTKCPSQHHLRGFKDIMCINAQHSLVYRKHSINGSYGDDCYHFVPFSLNQSALHSRSSLVMFSGSSSIKNRQNLSSTSYHSLFQVLLLQISLPGLKPHVQVRLGVLSQASCPFLSHLQLCLIPPRP